MKIHYTAWYRGPTGTLHPIHGTLIQEQLDAWIEMELDKETINHESVEFDSVDYDSFEP